MRGQCGPRRNAVALVETAPKILLLKQKKAVLSRCEIVSVDKPIAFINPAASFSLRVRDRFFQLRWKVNEGDVKQGRQSSLYRIFLRWSFHCWRKEAHVCSNTWLWMNGLMEAAIHKLLSNETFCTSFNHPSPGLRLWFELLQMGPVGQRVNWRMVIRGSS